MPFYEYQCRACGAQVEVMQKISDAPLRKCPECGRNMLTKLVSAPVFRLKGGGWYETDFKTDQDRKRNLVEAEKADSKPEEKAGSQAEAKADTKADTRAESKAEAKPESGPEARAKAAEKPAAKPVPKKPPPTGKPGIKAGRSSRSR
jgi:putative FmdB family regulatory protein